MVGWILCDGPDLMERRLAKIPPMETPDRDGYLDAVLIGGREPRSIVIAEYDPAWPARFEQERVRIATALAPPLTAAGYELRVREVGHRMFRAPGRDVHVHVWRDGDDEARHE
jgi:GrpB-like predicted nucleotidyltransferase (UPF0157 family)